MRNDVMSGGYRIANLNSTGSTVTTQLSVTGARQLNRLGDKGATYRHEFLGFDAGGAADAAWILKRSQTLTMEYLQQDIARARRVKLRGQRPVSTT